VIVLLYHGGLARHDLCRHQYYDIWDINDNYHLQLLSAFHLSSHFAMFHIMEAQDIYFSFHSPASFISIGFVFTVTITVTACYCRSPLIYLSSLADVTFPLIVDC
jgi:hypothetical protein